MRERPYHGGAAGTRRVRTLSRGAARARRARRGSPEPERALVPPAGARGGARGPPAARPRGGGRGGAPGPPRQLGGGGGRRVVAPERVGGGDEPLQPRVGGAPDIDIRAD